MENSKEYKKGTLCVQAGWQPKNGEPRILPIYQSTAISTPDCKIRPMIV